jgi:RNA polymerase sigma-70 factor (ECF subfamily)
VEDAELLARLRSGDERSFIMLVQRYQEPMLRLAASFVPSRAVAEEVVQDTWLAMLRGIGSFQGRSSVKTWLFQILVNRARTAGTQEQRSTPVVDPARFDESGGWSDPPAEWISAADDLRLAARIREWIDLLPERQRQVVLLRDVEGLTPAEACAVLEISETNQRVLLHRGRSRLRELCEDEYREAQ